MLATILYFPGREIWVAGPALFQASVLSRLNIVTGIIFFTSLSRTTPVFLVPNFGHLTFFLTERRIGRLLFMHSATVGVTARLTVSPEAIGGRLLRMPELRGSRLGYSTSAA